MEALAEDLSLADLLEESVDHRETDGSLAAAGVDLENIKGLAAGKGDTAQDTPVEKQLDLHHQEGTGEKVEQYTAALYSEQRQGKGKK